MSEELESHDDNAAPSPVDDITDSSPEADLEAKGQEEASAKEGEQAEKPNRTQERINQLARERREAVQRAEELEERLKALETTHKPAKVDSVAPNPDDFDSDQEYQTANAQFYADVSRQGYEAERIKSDEEVRRQERQQTIQDEKAAFNEKVDIKREHFQDFEEVAYGHPYMDMDMARLVFKLDNAPEVAYKIGLNGGEIAESISKLSADDRVRELTKLDFQVEALAPKRVSDAPDPIKPLGSSEAIDNVGVNGENITDADEWQTWRNQQLHG